MTKRKSIADLKRHSGPYLPWTPEKWGDGYIDATARCRVYRPDYPRAWYGGYAFRSHIVWWLTTGQVVPKGMELHHINKVTTDDRFDNLEILSKSEHRKLHQPIAMSDVVCNRCGKHYETPTYRIINRAKAGYKKRYCSPKCQYAALMSQEVRDKISAALKKTHANKRRRKLCLAVV